MTDGLTHHIAGFAAGLDFEDIPGEVIERGKVHILDAMGLALAGSRSKAVEIVLGHVRALGCGNAGATVLGTSLDMAPRFAAHVNAVSIHAENFDDTNPQESPARNGGIHATGPVLAAALAAAEDLHASGRDLLAAFHAGMEVACRLNHAIGARHYEEGFHSTGTLNAFGAAMAAGRVMGLGADRLCHALAGAASRAGGIRRNFGSMVEQLHAGQAAEDGYLAAELAERGLTGAGDALEGRFGYLQAAGAGYDPDAIVGRLGAPWTFIDPGMWIKPFPSGALTHPGMTLALDLVATHEIAADRVESINVRTNRRVLNTLIHHRPEAGLQAKFSMEFCLAIMVLERKAGLREFTDVAVNRADVREMIARIDYGAYEDAAPDYSNVTTLLEIHLADGRTLEGRADFAKGSTRDPMSYDDVADKFMQCADYAEWPADRAQAAIEAVARLDTIDDLSDLTSAVRSAGADPP